MTLSPGLSLEYTISRYKGINVPNDLIVAIASEYQTSLEYAIYLNWVNVPSQVLNTINAHNVDEVLEFSNNLVVTTGSTTGRMLSDRFADIINVKDFGAKGDGITDDTIAIQTALNAAAVSFGGVFIPDGTYLIDPIYVSNPNITASQSPSPSFIQGNGHATVLKARNNCNCLINARNMSHVNIEHLVINCSYKAEIGIDTTWNTGNPIAPSLQNVFYDIFVEEYNDIGWVADNNNDTTFNQIVIRNPDISASIALKVHAGGGLFFLDKVTCFDKPLSISAQNATLKNYIGMGIIIGGESDNNIHILEGYIYADPASKTNIKVGVGVSCYGLEINSTRFENPYGSNGNIFDGMYMRGAVITNSYIFKTGGTGDPKLISSTSTNLNGGNAAEFRVIHGYLLNIDLNVPNSVGQWFILTKINTLMTDGSAGAKEHLGTNQRKISEPLYTQHGAAWDFPGGYTFGFNQLVGSSWTDLTLPTCYRGSAIMTICGHWDSEPVKTVCLSKSTVSQNGIVTILLEQAGTGSSSTYVIEVRWDANQKIQARCLNGDMILRVSGQGSFGA